MRSAGGNGGPKQSRLARRTVFTLGVVVALTVTALTPTVLAQSQSSDATLSALTLSDVDFGTFASSTTSYTASVAHRVTETTVSPTVNHSGASYVTKLDGTEDTDGEVSLSVGSNVITVEVTAEDGNATQTYTVTVTRAENSDASSDATLSALTLSDVDFGTFASSTTTYTASVANRVRKTTVTPTVNHSGATYVVKLGGTEDTDGEVSLSVESNVITVEVTAEDESTTQTYTVTVTRAANSPATGTPVISGTARVGETMTVDISSIADEDGIDLDGLWLGHTFEVVWTGDCIRQSHLQFGYYYGDETVNSYFYSLRNQVLSLVVPPEAAGSKVTVWVSFLDEAGHSEGFISEATAVVPRSIDGLTLVDTSDQSALATVNWKCKGDLEQTVVLDADGSYSFRVNVSSNAGVESVSWDLNDGAYSRTDDAAPYSLYGEDDGGDLDGNSLAAGNHTVEATAYSDDEDELQTFAATFKVTLNNRAATGAPTISGTAQVGQTLTASTSGISDSDGLTSVSYSYQWLADDTEIDAATSSTYTVQSTDNGKVIKVRVTFTDDADNEETLTSTGTSAVVLGGL